MSTKKIKAIVKLVIKAGAATPAPPIGPALGTTGINLMQFCKDFNDKTKTMVGAVPVLVTVYEDRSFEMEIKTPAVSELVKQALGIQSGSKNAGKVVVAKISEDKIREIAEKKMVDLNCHTVESAMNQVKGTCKSMGVRVE